MAHSIIEILDREHRQIERLFKRLREDVDNRDELFERLKGLLVEHSLSEERVLYPQLEALADLRTLGDDAREDHSVIDQLLIELDAKTLDAGDWIACLNLLEDNFEHHVRFEEQEIFPRLKQYFLNEELRIMGDEYQRVEGRVKQVQTMKGFWRSITRTVQYTFGIQLRRDL
ncbi:MAG TPA: hemerythrin domain-containing protein [Bdellovibrionales bacterium]|nr:hemerythrin domain-containing protein [Bdellovibrionales bacterium]